MSSITLIVNRNSVFLKSDYTGSHWGAH